MADIFDKTWEAVVTDVEKAVDADVKKPQIDAKDVVSRSHPRAMSVRPRSWWLPRAMSVRPRSWYMTSARQTCCCLLA